MQQLEQKTIGRYQIQSRLARGGMAEIYLAHDAENDCVVAIKVVHNSSLEYCERFRREVKAMSGLRHKHILPVFDYGEDVSWCYLVTPYIEYGTLGERLTRGPLSLNEAKDILEQLTNALQFAHEQGIIHRDIKPSNVLMHNGNHVYLADFGLVKRVGENNNLTVTGYLIGTPEYMAPELAEEEASPQSDVYALGVLLYQMLTGQVPFKGSTPMGVYLKHIREVAPPPTSFNPAIPPEVERVIIRALEKNPKRRIQSAQALYQAYTQAMQDAEQRRLTLMNRTTVMGGFFLWKPKALMVKAQSGNVMGQHKMPAALMVSLSAIVFPLLLGILISHAAGTGAANSTISQHQQYIHPAVGVTPTAVPTKEPTANPQPVLEQNTSPTHIIQQKNYSHGNGNNGENKHSNETD